MYEEDLRRRELEVLTSTEAVVHEQAQACIWCACRAACETAEQRDSWKAAQRLCRVGALSDVRTRLHLSRDCSVSARENRTREFCDWQFEQLVHRPASGIR
jgi:hypothetical protein